MRPMKSKRLIALLLVVLLLVSVGPGTGLGYTTEEFLAEIQTMQDAGIYSSDTINQVRIDLSQVETGSVTSKTYIGANQDLTECEFSVVSQTHMVAMDKLSRFACEMHNQYRPETLVAVTGTNQLYKEQSVSFYTYGVEKDKTIWALTDGIGDCLNGTINTSSGGNGNDSWFDKYTPENIDNTISTSTFVIGGLELITSVTNVDGTVSTTTIQMDVAPEIVDDRTYVPVRYLAYALGVPEEDVQWDGETETVTITKDDTVIGLTIGSTTETVNGEPVEMDVALYVKEIDTGGRTMLPARYIAEPLGSSIEWDDTLNQATIITPLE